MVDYSKWDNIDVSDSEEEDQPMPMRPQVGAHPQIAASTMMHDRMFFLPAYLCDRDEHIVRGWQRCWQPSLDLNVTPTL